jgi:hypothetical protein
MRFLRCPRCFGGMSRIGHMLFVRPSQRSLKLQASDSVIFDLVFAALVIINRFLRPQSGFLARLCPRSRKIPVLGPMQVRPGVERRYIFRSLSLVAPLSAICHWPLTEPGFSIMIPTSRRCAADNAHRLAPAPSRFTRQQSSVAEGSNSEQKVRRPRGFGRSRLQKMDTQES